MQRKGILAVGALAVVALAVACGTDQKPTSPTTPSAPVTMGDASAAADEVTLKVNGPTPSSPINGERLTRAEAVVTFAAATGKFVQGETYSYRVQLLNTGGTVLEEQTGTGVTYTFKSTLDSDTEYRWRARAELEGHAGAWSSTATFRSMERPTGYLRGNEVFDPLTESATVGNVLGSVTWLPGVGVRLNNSDSAIEYRLPTPCGSCEFSMIVSNVGGDSGLGKSKIMAMREEDGSGRGQREFLVDNNRRMTVEFREDSNIAWRFITHTDQVDTVGSERHPAGIRDENTYLWTADFRGHRFNLRIQQMPNLLTVYDFGKHYEGDEYDPNPHVAYVGSGTTFLMTSHGTVRGMVVRNVWLSPTPRPSWANQ